MVCSCLLDGMMPFLPNKHRTELLDDSSIAFSTMAALTDNPTSSVQAFPLLYILFNTIKVCQLNPGRKDRGSHNRVLPILHKAVDSITSGGGVWGGL